MSFPAGVNATGFGSLLYLGAYALADDVHASWLWPADSGHSCPVGAAGAGFGGGSGSIGSPGLFDIGRR